MKRKLSILLVVAMTISVFASCKTATPTSTASSSVPASSSEASSEVTSNPNEMLLLSLPEPTGDKFSAMWADYGGIIRVMMFSRLLMTDENLNPVIDDLASAHTVSTDGLTYTFTIRDGVKWQDGEPFTVDDVVWSIGMALKSVQITSLFTQNFRAIEGAQAYVDGTADSVSGLSVKGNVLTIKMAKVSSTFLLVMAQWPPYPKHLLENEPPETLHLSAFWEMPIGTGPYKCTEFVAGEYAILETWDGYWGPKPKIAKAKVGNYKEGDYVTQAQANTLDYFMTRSLAIVQEVLKNPNYVAHEVNILYDRYMNYNLAGYAGNGKAAFADIKSRQAISYAMDRETVTKQLFPGQGAVLNCMIPTGMPEYNDKVKVYNFDTAKAKTLLAEAKFDLTKTVKICYYYNDQQTQDLMNALVSNLTAAGLTCEHFLIQGDVTSALYDKREYDFAYVGFAPTCYEEMYAIFKSNDPTYIKIRPATPNAMDPLIDALNQCVDPAKRLTILDDLQVTEDTLLWQSYLFSLKNYVLVNEKRLNRTGEYGHEWTNYNRDIANWTMK